MSFQPVRFYQTGTFTVGNRLLPPEGVAESVLPEWRNTVAKILTAPAMGAAWKERYTRAAPWTCTRWPGR